MKIVKVEKVSRYYQVGRGRLQVLKEISLQIKAGEFLAIRGPSGAGKSTLLHIIGGLERPDAGKVYLLGEDIYKFNDLRLSQLRNKNIGFVFQFYHLIPELTLLENVALPLLIAEFRKGKAFQKAEELLSYLGLLERRNHYPNQLSGGEQQRAAIARAIIAEPKILLADEPTGNLDSQMGQEVLKLIKKINSERGTTVIIVTHDREVASWAELEVFIRDGRLRESF